MKVCGSRCGGRNEKDGVSKEGEDLRSTCRQLREDRQINMSALFPEMDQQTGSHITNDPFPGGLLIHFLVSLPVPPPVPGDTQENTGFAAIVHSS